MPPLHTVSAPRVGPAAAAFRNATSGPPPDNQSAAPAAPLPPRRLASHSGEDFYLSPSTDGPVMYINLEDYVSRSSGKVNAQFQRVIQLFRERCGARLHWGKVRREALLALPAPAAGGGAAANECGCSSAAKQNYSPPSPALCPAGRLAAARQVL